MCTRVREPQSVYGWPPQGTLVIVKSEKSDFITCCSPFCFRTMLNKRQTPHCRDSRDSNVDIAIVQHNIYNTAEKSRVFSKILPTYSRYTSVVCVYAYNAPTGTMYPAKRSRSPPECPLYLKTASPYRSLSKDSSSVNLLNMPEKAANK